MEDAALPCIATDVAVGRGGTAKGTENIGNRAIAVHVVGDVLVDSLAVRDGIGADVLVGVVVVHDDEITSQLAVDHQRVMQFGQDDLREVGIERGKVTGKLTGIGSTGFRVDVT